MMKMKINALDPRLVLTGISPVTFSPKMFLKEECSFRNSLFLDWENEDEPLYRNTHFLPHDI